MPCEDITADHCRGWVQHSRICFSRCMAMEDIRCDVDENLWPDLQEQQYVHQEYSFFSIALAHFSKQLLQQLLTLLNKYHFFFIKP